MMIIGFCNYYYKLLGLQLALYSINLTNKIEKHQRKMIVSPPHQLYVVNCSVSYKPPGKYIQNYVIDYECPLGKGNFSNVYRSFKVSQPHIPLVVKLVNLATLREQKILNLVWAQIQIMKATNNKNVISCKDVFWDQSWCYIFSQFCEGGNLESHLKKLKYVTESEMLHIIRDIFDGLSYLEKSKIIHRDIKAANIFLKDGKAVVADMGFAKFFYEPFFDLHIGSPPFMPPQAITKGYYNIKTDVWAFGILLYEIFHGESPFARCTDLNDLTRKVYIPLSVMNIRFDLSIQMKQLILSCLQIDIQKRPKFSDIQNSWYFRKLFHSEKSKTNDENFIYRSPLKTVNSNLNPVSISQTERKKKGEQNNIQKSPTFSRINKLKSDIKKKKQENAIVSIMTSNQISTSTKLKEENNQYEPRFSSHNKSISDKCDLENEQDITTEFSYKLVQKLPFRQALRKVKNVRNCVALSRTLKNRNYKISDIKDRLLKYSLNQVIFLQNKINDDEIKINQIDNQKKYSRLNKLSKILIDYRHEIQKQMKRKQDLQTRKLKQQHPSQQQSTKLKSSQLKRQMSNSELNNLSADIQYIIKSEYPFYSEDSKNLKDSEEYRKKLRQIIQQIKKDLKKEKVSEFQTKLDLQQNITNEEFPQKKLNKLTEIYG